MPDIFYDASEILGKTLVTTKDLPVYDHAPAPGYTPTQVAIVKAGNPAGTVYSYLDADPTQGRPNLWWIFFPANNYSNYYYIPHHVGDFSVDALKEQGALTIKEQIDQQNEANKPWYLQITDKIVPIALIAVLGAAAIRGALSKK